MPLDATVATPLPTPLARSAPRVAFWPVFAWLAIQMLALLAAGLRIPFSARFAVPAENLAIHEMLVVQIVASALLFPLLFPTFATGVIVVGSVPLMIQLAGVLAGEVDASRWASVCAYAAIWVLAMGLWNYALRTPRARLYGVAVAALLAIGGAMLAYLHREFGAPMQAFDWGRHGYLGPLVGAIALLEADARTGTAWAFLGGFALLGLGAVVVTHLRVNGPPLRRRQRG